MNIINLLIKYFTNKEFRIYIDSIIAIVGNKGGVADVLDAELDEFKKKTTDRLKKRVDELTDAITIVRNFPGSELLVSKLNFILNELKDDFKEINEMD